jgi:hypothetical protein
VPEPIDSAGNLLLLERYPLRLNLRLLWGERRERWR